MNKVYFNNSGRPDTLQRCAPLLLSAVLLLLPLLFPQAVKATHIDQKVSFGSIQQLDVSGLVTDSTGSPLPGVSVSVKDKPLSSTTTDLNGRYSLQVSRGSVLVFSMVGYETHEEVIEDETIVNVILQASTSNIDEVVVVAFGKQKRTDMVGSVTSINPSELKVPSSNLTTSLAGRLAGMIAYQRSGEPGQDNADFFIRGVTTFGYNRNPLILIDNIELSTTDLARLQPDDIQSFSIMKDATATALYGARGANGVILVTTKEGKEGKANVNARVETSVSTPTRNVELADPITYMRLHNEAILTRDPSLPTLYSQDKIDNTVPGSGSLIYPSTDWRKALFKDFAINQRANLSVSGGGSITRYYVSGTFNQDNGVLKVDPRNNFNSNINLKTYSVRSNVNVNLTKSTELALRVSGSFDDYTGPVDGGTSMYRKVMRSNPVLFPAAYPVDADHHFVKHIMFGNYEDGSYLNPYADLMRGYKDYSRSSIVAITELKQDLSFLAPGLAFRGLINTTRHSYFDVSRTYVPFWYQLAGYDRRTGDYNVNIVNPDQGREYLDFVQGPREISSSFYLESALSYNQVFNEKHGLSALLVFIQRQKLEGQATSLQASLPFRNVGLSGRATYSYDNRYFAEFNFGYNGSERFYKQHRFGFFPSAGLAWTVSNEKFWEPLAATISNLRLRGTYGLVGNDAIGDPENRFMYLSEVDMNDSNLRSQFGRNYGYARDGIRVLRYSDQNITWETSKKMNLALEVGLFNKAQLIAEYFTENRSNILQTRAATPASMGLSAQPRANVGKAAGKGVDVEFNYNEAFLNGMWLQGRLNFTYSTSKYLHYEEYDYTDEPWLSRVGYPMDQRWGYIAESLFIDDYEVANSPVQNFGPYLAGDIKYRDLNGDGQITTRDQVPIGYPTTPEIVYGFGFSAGYKGFDVSAFFQGLTRESFWIDPRATAPFNYYLYDGESIFGQPGNLQNQLLKAYADSYWSEDNRDIYALWPRLSTTQIDNNIQTSTWFMRDGAFLRLKQVEVGYSIPTKLAERIRMSSLRIYANGTNLLTWSNFKLWDVEMAGNGLGYPVQKIFNLGLNLSF